MTSASTRPIATAGTFLADLTEVVEEVRAGAADRDRDRTYAVQEVDRLREIGFWAATVPTGHGGLGLDQATLIQGILLLAGADGSLGQIPQNHFMTVERIRLTGTAEQRDHWLGALGAGAVFGNASAEPGERPPARASRHSTRCPAVGGSMVARCTPQVRCWPTTSPYRCAGPVASSAPLWWPATPTGW